MIRLVEPKELAAIKRAAGFTLTEIADVTFDYTGTKVDSTSLSNFLAGKCNLRLEPWKAVSAWYIFFMECAPQPSDFADERPN